VDLTFFWGGCSATESVTLEDEGSLRDAFLGGGPGVGERDGASTVDISSSSSSFFSRVKPAHRPSTSAERSQVQIGRLILELVLIYKHWMFSHPFFMWDTTAGRAV